jgi:2-polyprenyl-3-methyl-5-hydroxy-6-metoxy-1,4-benzoquinol methylase
MKMLSKRFKYDRKSIIGLNDLQVKQKKQIERKIKKGVYSFEEVPCSICGGKNFESLSGKDRYGLYVPVVVCKDCGLIQTNPRMTQESYNQFYDTEYRKLYVGNDVPTDEFFKSEADTGKTIYQYFKKSKKIGMELANLKVLEVGTGAGGILYYFKEKGNEVYGFDLGSEYIEFGRDKYNLNLHVGTIDDIDINFTPDIVIYSDVLEHMLNPIEELIKLKSICDSNTYLYVALPGVKYLTHSYGTDFLRSLQNAHIHYFTLSTLKNVLRKGGWDFVCGNESICSVFKMSSTQMENKYENDYTDVMAFLRRMKYYRFLPTPYRVRSFMISTTGSFLRKVSLYNTVKGICLKFKS